MFYNRTTTIFAAVCFLALISWMAYFFYFRTDGRGHILREADSSEAAASGQRILARADMLTSQKQYDDAKFLLDSLRDADANPAMFISDDDLEQRMDSLRRQSYRARLAAEGK